MLNAKPFIALVLLAMVAVGCSADKREVRMDRPVFLKTDRNEKVFVSVRNSSSCQSYPVESVIRSELEGKGYTLVDKRADADIELSVLVRFCGLEKDAVKGDKTVGGAVIGGAAGGIGAAAGKSSGAGVAIGVLIGSILGAGTGYLMESQNLKNSFVSLVDIQIEQKGGSTERSQIAARVKQKDLTEQQAVDMIARDVGMQIAGLF